MRKVKSALSETAIPCLLALFLCAIAALLALPQKSEAALTDGLVGHWTFDGPDVTTTVTDRSGQNSHGYFNGGATSSAKVAGKLGQPSPLMASMIL